MTYHVRHFVPADLELVDLITHLTAAADAGYPRAAEWEHRARLISDQLTVAHQLSASQEPQAEVKPLAA